MATSTLPERGQNTATFSTDGYPVKVDTSSFMKTLGNKVIVLTGGASGIGRATVELLYQSGACIVFGDSNHELGENVADSMLDDTKCCRFVPLDASSYDSTLDLFKEAREQYGRIDHAIACAGIIEQGDWFGEDNTIESVQKPEIERVIDVNLKGMAYFSRIAIPYLRDGKTEEDDKSLVLLSSPAGFRESPALPIYAATKHGIMGLMRSLKNNIYPKHGIRVNCVNPGMTETGMTTTIVQAYRETKQPVNTPEDVAQYIVGAVAEKERDGNVWNGKAVYVEGGRGWEVEKGMQDTMDVWMGQEPVVGMKEGLTKLKKWQVRKQK